MALIHIERGEIVPVILDLRPSCDREAKVCKNLCQLVHHLADRMHTAALAFGRRQSEIERLACQFLLQRCAFQTVFAGRNRVCHFGARCLNSRRSFGAFVRGHLPKRLQGERHPALLAQSRHALLVQRIQRFGRFNRCQCSRFLIVQFGHRNVLSQCVEGAP